MDHLHTIKILVMDMVMVKEKKNVLFSMIKIIIKNSLWKINSSSIIKLNHHMRTKTLSIFNLVKSDKYKCRNSDKIGTFFSSFNITNHQSFCQKMKQRHQRYVEVRRRSSVQYLSALSTEASSRLCFSEKYFILN